MMLRLFDTHFHYYGEATPLEMMACCRNDLSLNGGVLGVPVSDVELTVLAAGGDYLESVRSREFANVVDSAYFSCGVHPHQAGEYLKDPQDFSEFCGEKKLVAVGEIGLDYFYEQSPRDEQRKVFEQFLKLALEWDLPAMLHLRDGDGRSDAYSDALSMLGDFVRDGGRFVVHCCTAECDYAEKLLALGAMIGVTGMVTFKGASNVREMLKIVPDERLLSETDSPYLAPVPFRGKDNTPGMVPLVIKRLAEERSMTFEEMAELTTVNGMRFYNIGER